MTHLAFASYQRISTRWEKNLNSFKGEIKQIWLPQGEIKNTMDFLKGRLQTLNFLLGKKDTLDFLKGKLKTHLGLPQGSFSKAPWISSRGDKKWKHLGLTEGDLHQNQGDHCSTTSNHQRNGKTSLKKTIMWNPDEDLPSIQPLTWGRTLRNRKSSVDDEVTDKFHRSSPHCCITQLVKL